MKESTYQLNVKKLLDERGSYHEVIWGGGFQASGIPDILVCYRGIYIGLELKVGRNKPSPLQLAKIDVIRQNGGIGAITWEKLEPIIDILDTIDLALDTNDLEKLDSVRCKYTERKDSI